MPVLAALAIAHDDLVAREVDILHAQAQALHQTHAGPVEQAGHQPRPAIHRREQPCRLLASQHRRQTTRTLRAHNLVQPRQFDPKHFAIQIQQRGEGLVLRRRGDIAFGGQAAQKRLDLCRSQLPRMTLAIRENEPPYPSHVRLLCTQAVVFDTQLAPNFVQQAWSLRPSLFSCYAPVSDLITHYAPASRQLQRSLATDYRHGYRVTACRSVGISLDVQSKQTEHSVQRPGYGVYL